MSLCTVRNAVSIVLVAIAIPAMGQSDRATKPLRVIVPFAAGSFIDISARTMALERTEQRNQQTLAGQACGVQHKIRVCKDVIAGAGVKLD